jgi:ComF family protein
VNAALLEVLDLLLPARCLGCEDRLPLDGPAAPVCSGCLSRLREPPWPRCPRCHFPTGTGRVSSECLTCGDWAPALVAARSAVILESPADRLVHALKYEGWRELAGALAERMALVELPDDTSNGRPLVVPVPTTAKRMRRRGYNQAALLAERYAALRHLEYFPALVRAGQGGSQVSLHPSQRRSNVRGSFAPAPGAESAVAGRPVILVDDVLTTGATVCEAAESLERVGALGVSVVTFARALPDRRRT